MSEARAAYMYLTAGCMRPIEIRADVREPSLLVLLRYARVAGVSVDKLLDDELDLPEKLGRSKPRKRR
jgi:hypothetical protein